MQLQWECRAVQQGKRKKRLSWRRAARINLKTTTAANRTLTADDCVLVAGGGPAGLTTAMALSMQGYRNITVVERREGPADEDPQRSYSYSIDLRSQRLLSQLGLMEQLPAIGLPTGDMKVHTVSPDGNVSSRSMAMKNKEIVNYWMPRSSFLQLLAHAVENQHSHSVRLLFNTAVDSIELGHGSGCTSPVHACLRNADTGETEHLQPSLLVGADGVNSKVREVLAQYDPGTRFHMQKKHSPSAGLKFKVLSVPTSLPLGKDTDECADVTEAVIYQPNVKEKNRRVRLGSLPQKDSSRRRSMNVINFPSHSMWSARDADTVYSLLEENLPQLNVRSIISSDEAQRFAEREEGAFPPPQCPEQLTALLHHDGIVTATSKDGGSTPDPNLFAGAVLVGDASHCFPPDLGQGVNSALEDVHELWKALDSYGGDIEEGLAAYDEQRIPDVHALIKLQQFSAPYQYNLEPLKNKAWGLNLLLRTQLSKLAPFMFDNASFMLLQQGLPYSEVLRRSHNTTRNIAAMATATGAMVTAAMMSMA